MITIYGIPNCTSVKKTRVWLTEHGVEYVFHDFKKLGIDAVTLKHWLKSIPPEILINKKGTTWRGLSATEQASEPVELMMAHTSVIKRPVVVSDGHIFVGHNETLLQSLL